ncbi:MAG: lipopolysaccharide heptosyltransferase II [Phycisphaerae bacterium]|nr:lipopolysaccharide heptosyltransferase II [Phycisphaerae bacterium]
MRGDADSQVRRLLVVIPNWVGDVVLATPVLAALRAHFRAARITYLMRHYVSEIVDGGRWHNQALHWPAGSGLRREIRTLRMARRLRAERFELAILLTNSFRSALFAWRAGIRRRVGYAREARGWMLTDRLRPLKRNGEFVPSPVLPYYIKLAEHVGCSVTDRQVRLGITPRQERAGQDLLRHYGLADGRRYALVNPGAAFGAAKCWLPERFSEVCDRLHVEHGFQVVLVGAPHELALLQKIAAEAKSAVICPEKPGTTLGSLKVLVREAALLVCNDTGPRHYGSAFSIPTVTIFGPTHQAWTDTDYEGEIKLQIPVECGPCQLKICPIDLRCMTGLTTEMVMQAVADILQRRRPHDCGLEQACKPAGGGQAPVECRED